MSRIAVVIPAYRVEKQIAQVVAKLPKAVDEIVIVNDCSPDGTAQALMEIKDRRVHVLTHLKNMGVGGAMLSGYSYALHLGCEVVVKLDGDDQMDPAYINTIIQPILNRQADYVKGNRFLHQAELTRMPLIRLIGNVGLTFLTKLASGYWNVFDPTNGYTAISGEKLGQLDPARISRNYFFETSMLCELRKLDAVVTDLPMPAIYQDEKSSVSIGRELFVFSSNLLRRFFHRMTRQYFLYNFSAVSLYMVLGTLLGLFGGIWGIVKWVKSVQTGIPATTGTVLLAVLPVILAVQFLTQAIALDIESVPSQVSGNVPTGNSGSSFLKMSGYYDMLISENLLVITRE
jgi:glycosyltransferase involved in cell wall biosynthesis